MGKKKLPWLSMESSRSEVEDSCRQGPISSREEPEELCCCIHADSQLLLAVSWQQLTVSTHSYTSRESLFEVILSLFVGIMKMIQTGVFFQGWMILISFIQSLIKTTRYCSRAFYCNASNCFFVFQTCFFNHFLRLLSQLYII